MWRERERDMQGPLKNVFMLCGWGALSMLICAVCVGCLFVCLFVCLLVC